MKCLHLIFNSCLCTCHNSFKFCIKIKACTILICTRTCRVGTCLCNIAAKILIWHGNCSVYKITKRIGKVWIHTLNHKLPWNNTIIFKRHFVKDKISYSVNAKHIYKVICINNIAFWLTHLTIALQKPWVSKYLLWKRFTECHKEYRPVNRMESDNILSDKMKVCRPELLILFAWVTVCIITYTCNIVSKSIKPHIDYMLIIKINRDTPFERCSWYT